VINFAMKKMLFVVPCTIAAIGLASPANAFQAPERLASASDIRTVPTSNSSAPAPAAKNAKVCITMPALTGSRMPTRQCKTKAQWEALGYELGEKE
jgi:hypothetical protein